MNTHSWAQAPTILIVQDAEASFSAETGMPIDLQLSA